MAARKKAPARKTAPSRKKAGSRRTARRAVTAEEVLAWLERKGTEKQIREMDRYGITADRAFGVSVGDLRKYAKGIQRDHALAEALWASGWYEARMLATMIDEPEKVSVAQMNRWARDFDNWAIVDTACFSLFDRTAHAWKRLPVWAKAKGEFQRRAAFALLWSLSTHDKDAPDSAFLDALPLIVKGATDERNFVKKAVNMALRAVGKRNRKLHAAALRVAKELAMAEDPTPRWIGSHALRELTSATVKKRLA